MQTSRLRDSVEPRIRRRGLEYFQSGHVDIIVGGDLDVHAIVSGTEDYDVSLGLCAGGRALWCACTCPYHEDRAEVCKHAWALALDCEANGYLSAIAKTGPVRLVPLGLLDEEDTAGEEPEDFDDDEERVFTISPRTHSWQTRLGWVARRAHSSPVDELPWLGERQILYQIDAPRSRDHGDIIVDLRYRDRKRDGSWSIAKSQAPSIATIPRLPDAADQTLLAMIAGGGDLSNAYSYSGHPEKASNRFTIPVPTQRAWMRLAAETGRLSLIEGTDAVELTWEEGEPWELGIEVLRADTGASWRIQGFLSRSNERRRLAEATLLSAAGLVFFGDTVAELDHGGGFSWVPELRHPEALEIPIEEGFELVEALQILPAPKKLQLPEELRYEEVLGEPRPAVHLTELEIPWQTRRMYQVELGFDYDGQIVERGDRRRGLYQPERSLVVSRNREAERAAEQRLRELGVRDDAAYRSDPDRPRDLVVGEKKMPDLVRVLTAEGWSVEVDGATYRQAGELSLTVSSGIDWFELDGDAEFDGASVAFPTLLEALERGHDTVELSDGSVGVLPTEWQDRLGRLADFGSIEGDHLRFGPQQVGLVDALLAAQPEIRFDRTVAKARERLEGFTRIEPCQPPPSFRGVLRDYQQEGLGWLHFLRELGFGGCLADDMGLGKTVQVLALLESRRVERERFEKEGRSIPPSLVVVPSSLIFNWRREAERFAPQLRVAQHTGQPRAKDPSGFAGFDIVLTTYGTLRRDVSWLSTFQFDYAILDESQAIKNNKSATAKAARLLGANHRLALSGTPIENRLGELFSLFDFLNPGLFGRGKVRAPRSSARAAAAETSESTLSLIAAAVRPFVLRRTKEQVASDLPEKIEETLYCELPPKQRKEYDQLREHYRLALTGRIEKQGLKGSKLLVIEALLRLRQAACHPGLLDSSRTGEASAKLELLLERIEEVTSAGKKALVFSQFTSMLAIVRPRLDALGIRYEYLDGKTRQRQAVVDRFQQDSDCPLFLISLKAGGLGLNLTAAEYVFLLDPWWNPAVEAQAIDRAHRIGQTRRVFAYNLIAQDTVEGKVLELQRSKRALANAIITADSSMIRDLTRDDLALLLS